MKVENLTKEKLIEVILGEIEQDDVYAAEMILDSIRTICESQNNGWIKIEDRLPDGHYDLRTTELEVIGFNENWIHPDFNPNGTRICTYFDAGWTSAKWCDNQDCYSSVEEEAPTHWQSPPSRP